MGPRYISLRRETIESFPNLSHRTEVAYTYRPRHTRQLEYIRSRVVTPTTPSEADNPVGAGRIDEIEQVDHAIVNVYEN